MRGRPKKRKSTVQVYETVPNLKQSRIGPSPHRTIRDKHSTWSAPNMRQQSITQMDALRDYYHPDLENEYLKTDDEEEDSYVASPTRNKRRKVTPEKPHTRSIETRSVKREAAKEERSSQKQEEQKFLPKARGEVKAHMSGFKMSTAMLPPKTPVSLRRKEIPSSQSPADTPLSLQSRHSLQDYTRSPLKAKSTNIDLPVNTPVKGSRWSKRTEVADSLDTEDEDSPGSMRVGPTVEPAVLNAEPEYTAEEESRIPSNAFAIHVDDFNQRLKAAQRPIQEIQNSSQARPRQEVIDSTDEEDSQEEAGAFNAGPETQAALASTDVSEKSSDQPPHSTPPTSKPSEDAPELAPSQRNASNSLTPPTAPSPPSVSSDPEQQLPTKRPKKVEFVDLASSDPPEPPTPRNDRPTESTKASAQLLADLRRETQPYGLETESQFENGWTTYTPADDTHSDLDPSPSSPYPIQPEPPSSALMSVPTQLIRPPIATPPKFYRAPVPPSQATTVDVTQPSPRIVAPSSPGAEQRSPRMGATSSQAYPSSPPPVPPAESSPTAGRKVEAWEGYVWDGVRLRDSQLVPDSLMDEGEGGPMGFSQESWDGEL